MKRKLFQNIVAGLTGTLLLALAMTAQAQTNVATYSDLFNACSSGGSGNITLTANILDGATQLTIERSLTIDLNGHSLTINLPDAIGRNSNGIWLANDVTLTIMDSNPGTNSLTVTNGAALSTGT
ncbi:MAG: hypothetical protein LBE56_10235, partial [Tannerella sp.]|nr:hypothetical protein [Tannerella sp.]